MAIINPVYALIVPFLFAFTIPLAILAGITTTLAFSVLMFRVAVVYVDIAVNMIPQYLTGRRAYAFPRGYARSLPSATDAPPPNMPPSPAASGTSSPPTSRRHHQRRRTSGASLHSLGSATPVDDYGSKRNSFMMIPSIGMDRDFEGVGGWRLGGRNPGGGGDDDDDDAWTHINSRLELPLDHQRKHHQRSPSGGSAGEFLMMKSLASARAQDQSPEHGGGRRSRDRKDKDGGAGAGAGGDKAAGGPVVMSPNSSRVRTPMNTMPPPLTTLTEGDGYFPRQPRN